MNTLAIILCHHHHQAASSPPWWVFVGAFVLGIALAVIATWPAWKEIVDSKPPGYYDKH